MKDEQTNNYTNTYTPSSIISDQWGADEAAELLGWNSEEDDYEEEDDDDCI